jgi:hypothetical protein
MKKIIIIFLIAFHPIIGMSQIWDSLILKTHPLRDFVAQNPNICFEKILNKKMSVELEFTYKTQQSLALSGEGFIVSPQTYYNCNGYKILISTKGYFTKSKKIPKAWYLSGQFGYSNIDMPHLTYWHLGFTCKEHRKMELFDFNFLCGKGLLIFRHISSEINFGPGLYYETDNIKSFDNTERNRSFYGWGMNFYLNWTIGYLISKK